jgi:ADP-heptose:LPS heptosyltransferase
VFPVGLSGKFSCVTADLGSVLPRFDDVRRVAVLRAGGLGDLMFALPAVQALRTTYPDAEVVLLGTPAHAALLADRPGPVSRVLTLPVSRGVFEPSPGAEPDPDATEDFFARAKAERFDLAVQAHGGGRWSNPFTRGLGARYTVGTRTPDAEPLDRCLPYRYHQHEALRWLEVVGLAGATGDPRAHLAVTERDWVAATPALDGLPRPVVTLHPGATDSRRRWPAEKFAELATRLVSSGVGVTVVGSTDEADLVDQVVAGVRRRLPAACAGNVRGLAGSVDLSGLVGVLAASAVVVANDSGPRHIADAVGTPTVSVFWCGNMINAGPFGRAVHRPHISWTVACPICGNDLTSPDTPDCAHTASWVAGVAVDDVLGDTVDLLNRSRSGC